MFIVLAFQERAELKLGASLTCYPAIPCNFGISCFSAQWLCRKISLRPMGASKGCSRWILCQSLDPSDLLPTGLYCALECHTLKSGDGLGLTKNGLALVWLHGAGTGVRLSDNQDALLSLNQNRNKIFTLLASLPVSMITSLDLGVWIVDVY
jgi:hypothetical protein